MAASRGPWAGALRTGLRWLYFGHRWLGVAACLFFATWFFSGLVMMYVPFPSLTQAERLDRLPAIDWEAVRLGPQAALTQAGLQAYPVELRLEMMGAEPVYRLAGNGGQVVVSAVDGEVSGPIGADQAQRIAQILSPVGKPVLRQELARDQWTVSGGYDAARPLYLFDLGDGRGGRLYISRRTGEAVLDTHARERFWNWVGSVPHWLYPTVLRQHQPVWRQVVMWCSGVGIVAAVTGMWIGLLRMRVRRKPGQPVSPYRGWMKWHHWAGLVGGVFVTTWIVSGWWSVNPFRWFDSPSVPDAALARYAGQTQPRMPADIAALRTAGASAKQARFYWLRGRPLVAFAAPGRTWVVDAVAATPGLAGDAWLFSAAGALMDGAPVASAVRQTQEDDYWYSHHTPRPLPVLKVVYGDPERSWIYIDPVTGQVLDISNASSRAYRWVFSGLHQMDFPFLIHRRPLWDAVVWLLSAGGIVTSISGVVIGWRRLRRPRRARA